MNVLFNLYMDTKKLYIIYIEHPVDNNVNGHNKFNKLCPFLSVQSSKFKICAHNLVSNIHSR